MSYQWVTLSGYLNASKQNAQLYKKWFGADPRFPLNPQY
jgi:polar amino acid transport system substrate-binding protein